jgi:ADP-L-glycero-D-manno-heptose 6-epimerase
MVIKMIIVTGGAGFIGSCVVRTLNDAEIEDIVIVDDIGTTDKWLNIRNKKYIKYVHKDLFLEELPTYEGVAAIIHMGAQSATTERDFDYLYRNNFEYTKALWNYCTEKQIQFIYASSAATYGGGSM